MNIDKMIKEKFFFKKDNPFKFIYFFINKVISFFRYNKSYSQGAMDLILKDIFKDKDRGTYIDVGCQHPIKNNNTYLLFKKGWKGLNIDLDEMNIELFNFNRPNDYNIKAAISDKIEEVDLFFYHQKSPINTLDKKISDRQKAKLNKVIKIKTDTLTNILKKTSITDIDILSIDVEGFEIKVLKGLDFELYTPKLIIVEYLDLNAKKWEIPFNDFKNVENSEIFRFLSSKNYKLVNWVNGDLIFVKIDQIF